MAEREPPVRRVAARLEFANRYVRVFDDEVVRGDRPGRQLRIEAATIGRGVVVIAEYAGRCALVRTYRYAVGAWQWGLPRGFAHGTDSRLTAAAEVGEELGTRITGLRLLGTVTPDSGLLATRVDVYHAIVEDLSMKTEDPDEVAEIRWVPRDQLLDLVASGEIEDGFTLAALCLDIASGRPGRRPPADGPLG